MFLAKYTPTNSFESMASHDTIIEYVTNHFPGYSFTVRFALFFLKALIS